MTGIRLSGQRGMTTEFINPGDTILSSEVFTNITTVGNSAITAAQMLTGIIYRTGPTGAYSDSIDSPVNILTALQGNLQGAPIVPGLSFKLRYVNSVAFGATIVWGSSVGLQTGLGVVTTVAASSWRDYTFTFLSVTPSVSSAVNTTSGSPVVLWTLAPGQTSELVGPSLLAINVSAGSTVQGTNIPANATILGVQQGQGGSLGFTMSANATGTGIVSANIGPTMLISSSGSGTL